MTISDQCLIKNEKPKHILWRQLSRWLASLALRRNFPAPGPRQGIRLISGNPIKVIRWNALYARTQEIRPRKVEKIKKKQEEKERGEESVEKG